MLLIEIVAPELNRSLKMSVDADTSIKKIRDRVIMALGIENDYAALWELIHVDECQKLDDVYTLKDSNVGSGSILLLMKKEAVYANI